MRVRIGLDQYIEREPRPDDVCACGHQRREHNGVRFKCLHITPLSYWERLIRSKRRSICGCPFFVYPDEYLDVVTHAVYEGY